MPRKLLTIFLSHFLIFNFSLCHTSALPNEPLSLKINTDLTKDNFSDALRGVKDSPSGASDVSNFNSVATQTSNATQDAEENSHVCTREETYQEPYEVTAVQPVRIRSNAWCMKIPPRCSSYRDEERTIVKVEYMTKKRTIKFCCPGYEKGTGSSTTCKPLCRSGCGRGFCEAPNVCRCEAGYVGQFCTERCNHDHWGIDCKNECRCQNGAACDNKSGMCHCSSGWTGEFCEQRCPLGTYGVMCHKKCECPVNNSCHPHNGTCEPPTGHRAIIERLNSTIANITSNLDQIAKQFVNITATTATISTAPEVTTPHSPAVIVIKQNEQHAPKIIVHPQGSVEPDVIHVLATWPEGTNKSTPHEVKLAHFGGLTTAISKMEDIELLMPPTRTTVEADQDAKLLTTLLIVLLVVMILIACGFLYIYRRYHWHRESVEVALAARSAGHKNGENEMSFEEPHTGKTNFLKSLPALPVISQMVRIKIEEPAYYDTPPSSNCSHKTPSYTYARKESLYSVVAPKSRKGSPDSHLYDEIRYHTELEQRHQHQHYNHPPPPRPHQAVFAPPALPPHSHRYHHDQPHYVTELVVPPQNSNYLQVPHLNSTNSPRVAHL